MRAEIRISVCVVPLYCTATSPQLLRGWFSNGTSGRLSATIGVVDGACSWGLIGVAIPLSSLLPDSAFILAEDMDVLPVPLFPPCSGLMLLHSSSLCSQRLSRCWRIWFLHLLHDTTHIIRQYIVRSCISRLLDEPYERVDGVFERLYLRLQRMDLFLLARVFQLHQVGLRELELRVELLVFLLQPVVAFLVIVLRGHLFLQHIIFDLVFDQLTREIAPEHIPKNLLHHIGIDLRYDVLQVAHDVLEVVTLHQWLLVRLQQCDRTPEEHVERFEKQQIEHAHHEPERKVRTEHGQYPGCGVQRLRDVVLIEPIVQLWYVVFQ
uniref:Uncharacterized protein n=1 Tax=Anopheles culicifacies TaxID=139723 RepID=A0A182M587_9DIPT